MRQHSLSNTGRCDRVSLVGEQLYYLLFYSSNSLCLLSKVEPIRLALSMALIFQVHVLSALILVMMYLPFYLYTFVKSPIAKKKETFITSPYSSHSVPLTDCQCLVSTPIFERD